MIYHFLLTVLSEGHYRIFKNWLTLSIFPRNNGRGDLTGALASGLRSVKCGPAHRFPQCSGYHVRLTHEKSQVGSWEQTKLQFLLLLSRYFSMQWRLVWASHSNNNHDDKSVRLWEKFHDLHRDKNIVTRQLSALTLFFHSNKQHERHEHEWIACLNVFYLHMSIIWKLRFAVSSDNYALWIHKQGKNGNSSISNSIKICCWINRRKTVASHCRSRCCILRPIVRPSDFMLFSSSEIWNRFLPYHGYRSVA